MERKKSWWDHKITYTRKEVIVLCWLCSIPIVGWAALTIVMLVRDKINK